MSKIESIIYNGQIVRKKDFSLGVDNRAFRYGDGLFETVRMFDGKLPFLEQHIHRLEKGLKFLQLELSKSSLGIDFWRYEIGRLAKYYHQKESSKYQNYRIRLSVFRNTGGFYSPQTNEASYVIEMSALDSSEFQWNKKGKKISIYDKVRLNNGKLSNLKTSNALPYVLAGLYNQQREFDDCLLLNNEGNIAESIHSNVFLLVNNRLITPDLKQGCTSGTMRKTIINVAKSMDIKVKEKACSIKDLKRASEVFLTNSINGIQWVKSYEGYSYDNSISKKLFKQLNEVIKQPIH